MARAMPETYTTIELLTAEQAKTNWPLIRRLAGKAVKLGPWRHKYSYGPTCDKCGTLLAADGKTWLPAHDEPCPLPDPDTRPMEVIASELAKKVSHAPSLHQTLLGLIGQYIQEKHGLSVEMYCGDCFGWWVFEATPAEQAAIALMVLLPERVKPLWPDHKQAIAHERAKLEADYAERIRIVLDKLAHAQGELSAVNQLLAAERGWAEKLLHLFRTSQELRQAMHEYREGGMLVEGPQAAEGAWRRREEVTPMSERIRWVFDTPLSTDREDVVDRDGKYLWSCSTPNEAIAVAAVINSFQKH